MPFLPEPFFQNRDNEFKNNSYISHLSYAEKKNILISADSKGVISFIGLSPIHLIKQMKPHNGDITVLDITPDEKYLITAGKDKSIKIWDIDTQKLLNSLDLNESTVFDAVVMKDSKTLITADQCAGLTFWDIETLQKKDVLNFLDCTDYHRGVEDIKLSHDEQYIAVATKEGMSFTEDSKDLYVFELATKKLIGSTWIGDSHLFYGNIAFSSDDQAVFAATMFNILPNGRIDWDNSVPRHLTKFDFKNNKLIPVANKPLNGNFILAQNNIFYSSGGDTNRKNVFWTLNHNEDSNIYTIPLLTCITSNIVVGLKHQFVGLDDKTIQSLNGLPTLIRLYEDGNWLTIDATGYFDASFDAREVLSVKRSQDKSMRMDEETYNKYHKPIFLEQLK